MNIHIFMTYFRAPNFSIVSIEWDNESKLTADSLSVLNYAPVHSVRQIGIEGDAAATAERAQLIDRWLQWRVMKTAIHTLYISYKLA